MAVRPAEPGGDALAGQVEQVQVEVAQHVQAAGVVVGGLHRVIVLAPRRQVVEFRSAAVVTLMVFSLVRSGLIMLLHYRAAPVLYR